jgi:hypothetical protein
MEFLWYQEADVVVPEERSEKEGIDPKRSFG